MRLFVVPISTRRTLLYCVRITAPAAHEATYIDRITTKAGNTWSKWEKAEKGWQKLVARWGNTLFDRIPFEEWGLKSIPPLTAKRKKEDVANMDEICVAYPSLMLNPSAILDEVRKLATQRQGLHSKWMTWSIVGMPFTIPVGLIPVLPNLPLFYLVFRAWSNWRGIFNVTPFLDNKGLIKPEPDPILDKLYVSDEVLGYLQELRMLMARLQQKLDTLKRNELYADDIEMVSDIDSLYSASKETEIVVRSLKARLGFGMVEPVNRSIGGHEKIQIYNTPHSNNSPGERLLLSGRTLNRLLQQYPQSGGLEAEIHRAVKQISKSLAEKGEFREEKQSSDIAAKSPQ